MRIKTGCALAVLAFLCFDEANCGALKKFFMKNQSADIETKADAEEQKTAEETTSTEASTSTTETTTTQTKEATPAAEAKETTKPAERKKIVGDPVVARIGKKEFRRSQILAEWG